MHADSPEESIFRAVFLVLAGLIERQPEKRFAREKNIKIPVDKAGVL